MFSMQKNKKKFRCIFVISILGIGSIFFLFCNILYGSISISFQDFIGFFMGKEIEEVYRQIFMEMRFPRAISAFWLGGALALSGYLLQTFFHNPIAGPFVLGISSGSKLAVALLIVFLLPRLGSVSSAALIIAAFFGALLSMGFVLFMSKKVKSMALLVISGVMIGYICSAITDFIITFAEDAEIINLHYWSVGSFSGMSWNHVIIIVLILSLVFIIVFFLSKSISAYQLGESYARNMGVNVRLLRIVLIILSSILSACVVAYAGPISFVGIAVPHLIQYFLGTKEPIWMIPAVFLGGSIFCLGCDLIARTIFAPTELSISTVTALFGVPVVLWVLYSKRPLAP